MTDTSTTVPVRRQVTVAAPPARAFQVFTTHVDTWWPRSHHLGDADLHEVVLEPRVGGRWYELGVDGSECDWGQVLVWEPSSRVVMTWQLNGRWEYDADQSRASEVEVRFEPAGDGSTVVTLEHRYLERLVEGDAARQGVSGEGGWSGMLAGYAAVVEAAAR